MPNLKTRRFLMLLLLTGLVGTWGCTPMAPVSGGDNGGNTDNGDGGDGGDNGGGGNNDGGDSGDGGTDGDGGNNGDNAGDPVGTSTLFVVNNAGPSVTFYTDAEALDGEIVPDGEVEAGAATSLFQPRSLVVTSNGHLLVSRQNGGVVGYNDSLTLNEDTTADLVVDGNNTLLEAPISFAYDAQADRLFVGNAAGEDGILVFDNVSQPAFDGEVAPNREFSPPDRSPINTKPFTIDAMAFDASGNLYVSDGEGDNTPNRNRILVFLNPGEADGEAMPIRTINSEAWEKHEDIFIDADDVLYVVDATDTIKMFPGASQLNGEVTDPNTLTVNIALTSLEGIVVSHMGTGFVADSENSAIYSFVEIKDQSGPRSPDRTLEGFETQLRAPRQLWLVEPELQN